MHYDEVDYSCNTNKSTLL